MRADCVLVEPETPGELAARIDHAGTIARGLGRSYGDAALNGGGQVVGMRRLDRYLGFDEATGTLTCEAGVSLARIIEDFAPRGFFPMITPGTKFVTVGGCIANDIHGKAHHAQGSFAASVDAFTLLLASGEVRRASREENADLFWATFGGMGLVGIVLTAELRLRRIETTYFRQRSIRVGDLAEMLATLEEHDRTFPYSVATLDVLATGARLGRGVVTVRRSRPPRRAAAKRWRAAPLRVSGPPKVAGPLRAARADAEPPQHPRGERVRSAHASARGPVRPLRRLLLSAGHDRRLEPRLWPTRVRPVPTGDPVRRRPRQDA